MKMPHSLKRPPSCIAVIALAAVWMSSTTDVSAQALNAQISLRPLTPQEKNVYSLGAAQVASGLNTIGVGQPAYLEVLVATAVKDVDITNITWTLTAKPSFSPAALAPSPLGTNVPPYKPADRLTLKVAGGEAGRTLLVPDLEGQYAVSVTVGYSKSNAPVTLSQKITASSYAGIGTCVLCHSEDAHAPLSQYHDWKSTGHAIAFSHEIDGGDDPATSHFAAYCLACHTTGYDANTNAVNGGFDDMAKQSGWTFPKSLTNGNWAAIQSQYPDVANLANVQCESCHGPGNQHVAAAGRTNAAGWPRLSFTYSAGDCSQCHDSPPYEKISTEWGNSRHAIATRSPSGSGRQACVRCHTASGFADFVKTGSEVITNTAYEAITCAACHDPHNATNPHQLRVYNSYTLPEGTTVTNAGAGALCMTCHHSRNGSGESNIYNYQRGLPVYAGGTGFGPHDSTSGEMIYGVSGITYGKQIPSGSHNTTITNLCVGCHMQDVSPTDPAFRQAGGHTFSMSYNVVENGVTNHVPKVDVCVKCHGHIEDFDMVRKDYNDDGVIEGIQTEVQKLLDHLSRMLPNSSYKANSNDYVADGQVKTIGRTSTRTNWPTKYLYAAWNHMFVNVEGSHGIHNAPYAVGLLKASIADLSGDGNTDGLPDWWQQTYFPNINDPSAAPNANPSGDGMPNWLKYGLGLDPRVPGTALADGSGVVFANGKTLGGDTNKIQIFTAAEVAFDTEVGKKYQIQSISSMGSGWVNVGTPIDGTGSAISYVTPTRKDVQQYYRVVTQ